MEAASDARYLHDVLRQMLQAPVFLDSSSLKDLRELITEGLYKSDVLLLMLTKGVMTRPWCLLECFAARKRGIPIVTVEIAGGGFSLNHAREYVTHLPERMAVENEAGLALLKAELGSTPIAELQQAVINVLPEEGGANLVWNASVGDRAMLASLKDIAEAMAAATGRKLYWRPAKGSGSTKLPWELAEAEDESFKRDASPNIASQRTSSQRSTLDDAQQPMGSSTPIHPNSIKLGNLRVLSHGVSHSIDGQTTKVAALVIFSGDQLSHARVLKAELARTLNRAVGLGDGAEHLMPQCDAVVVLLSSRLILTPHCVAQICAPPPPKSM